MTIKNISEKMGMIEIDLTGSEGNAFLLLGKAKSYCRMLEYSKEETNKLMKDMQSSDYENLISVFDDNFGNFVTLYR